MSPPPPPPPPLLLLLLPAVLLICSGHLPATLSAGVTFFPNCNRTFSCGSLQNITYPFTGGDRPEHCGPPGFRLICRDGYAELNMKSLIYRVLRIDQTGENLTLTRLDLWNNTCPSQFANSTLNFTIFNYGVGNEELNLFYGCDSVKLMTPSNQFNCNASGSASGNSSYAYYLIGPVPDPILKIIRCNTSLRIPVLQSAANSLTANNISLGEVLTVGFNVNYSNPCEAKCSACIAHGGQCGYDYDKEEPICICSDRICHVRGTGGNNVPKTIGYSVLGAVLLGIFLGCLFYFLAQRRRRASKAKSKDLPTPPSSKGIAPSLTGFSESIPSYPYTKSDIEKGSTYFGVQVFSYMELEEATNNFDPSRELGDGGFGTVYYGKLQDGRVVAVKRLYENNFKRVEQFMNEVQILTRLQHKNLVKLYGCTSRRSRELLLVYEYIPNGTVADHLHGKQANSGSITWPVRLSIAIETANALAYLHASEIIHRDVKTNNILLDNNFQVKVADFGLSRLFPTDVTHVSTAPQGTPGYVDPEYHQCYQLTSKSDVYSFGVVLMELISSKQAVDTNRHRHDINLANMAVNKILNHTLHELVDPSLGFESDSLVRRKITLVAELAFRCLQHERDMRPTMGEVLKALKRIENEESDVQKAEEVDINSEDIGLLKSNPPPVSPDSVVADKGVNPTTPYSF
ncbi:LEAF RUST 10 DISEASE-RESISTANCE LOCUS RECEPTOR-LIKE PROTEIN KINASE-like 1.4 isoform X2 [Vitis riparia]|uniref:LEAF RUST 10 DISEASE-RESISTANCE LOCUS RECEPTOR-LIKE PROTEIN KINASE-like 1.4 isoform X2 n=1 Tax=Vitis riparia TaxID=96939 RepID=UPI00155A4238|nr:LEAF RUST 10 DISEASE-RESISTANCE LOCUS RECEPTOR-LIKE PROTEIN KINASE-like 1.4 isoform X2 [Vitis riparia]